MFSGKCLCQNKKTIVLNSFFVMSAEIVLFFVTILIPQ